MAIVVNPFGTSMISGSVGGFVYSRNRGGNYVRRKAKSCVPQTAHSKHYKAVTFNQAVDAWWNLSSSSRSEWVAFAENQVSRNVLGQKITLSAYNWFIKFVSAQITYGFDIIDTPPLFLIPSYHPTITIDYVSSGYRITFSPSIPADHVIAIREGRYNSDMPIGHRRCVLSTVLDDSISSPYVFTDPCGANSGNEFLPIILCSFYNQFEVFTVNNYGCQSPRLFFQIYSST